MALPREKSLSQKEAESLLIDATEQPIERPKKGQKHYYSGKKKRHTLKTEIRKTLQGRIRRVSHSYPGSIHDFNLHKQESPLHPKSRERKRDLLTKRRRITTGRSLAFA